MALHSALNSHPHPHSHSHSLSHPQPVMRTAPYHGPVGRWLPHDRSVTKRWLAGVIQHVDEHPKPLVPVLQEFKDFIENNSVIHMLFQSMFDQVPHKRPYDKDPIGQKQVRDYDHMLSLFNEIITTAPAWDTKANAVGLIGFPINTIIDWPMGTPSGYAAFIREDVNAHFKAVLDTWTQYLESPPSASVLGDGPTGWFGREAVSALTEAAANGMVGAPSFADTFVCDPAAPYHGYTSWDNFFTRLFRPNIRPVVSPEDDSIIANACESSPYRLAIGVKERDSFWLKGQPYSLLDMLAFDERAPQFAGGTVYQAFLSALSYHRWHCPVSGKIVKAFIQPGTYFSETLSEGFGNPSGPDPAAPDHSQGYITAVATRALVFIQANDQRIGLMCFMAVGMSEVSSCEIFVQEGQEVVKGDDLGTFHFGGSTHCLIFRPETKLTFVPPANSPEDNEYNIPVRSEIARITGA